MASGIRSSLARAGLIAARSTVWTVGALAAVAIAVPMLQLPGARASRVADDDKPKVAAVPPAGPDAHVVQLNQDGQEKGGVETSVPRAIPFQTLVRAYGTVLALDRLTALYNASLTDAAQLKAAEVKATTSRVADERAQNLLKVFPTAKAQAEATNAAYQIDVAGVETAKAQLEALRNTAIQDWGPVIGPAIVMQSGVAQNLVLRRIGLVQLSLQPGTDTKPPDRIALVLGSGMQVEGTLVSEATQADPKVQTASFLYSIPMSSGVLPGTSVLAYLPRGGVKPGVGIPPSAVVWQAGKAWMYLRTAPDKFERRPLDEAAMPTADGGFVVPARSVPQNKPLVVAGAQILLSQESRSQIPSDEDDN